MTVLTMTSSSNSNPSAFEWARTKLRDYIQEHELRPGDPLPSVAQMAQLFDVSVTSLREALRALEAAGVVSIRHGAGTFVDAFDYAAIIENLSFSVMFDDKVLLHLLGVREALEVGALAPAIETLETEDLDALDVLVEEMLSSEGSFEAELEFHRLVFGHLENQLFDQLLGFLQQGLVETDGSAMACAMTPRLRYALHIELIEALRDENVIMAGDVLRRYFRRIRAALERDDE